MLSFFECVVLLYATVGGSLLILFVLWWLGRSLKPVARFFKVDATQSVLPEWEADHRLWLLSPLHRVGRKDAPRR